MAAIDFPASPTLNQVFASTNGVNYQWNGTLWLAVGPASSTTPGGDFTAYYGSGDFSLGVGAVLVPASIISGNSGGWYNTSNGRFTPPAGRYQIVGGLSALNTGAAFNCILVVRKNGVAVASQQETSAGANGLINPTVAINVDANGTDYFDLVATPNVTSTGRYILFTAFPISGIKGPPGDPGQLGFRLLQRTVVSSAVASVDIVGIASDINDLKFTFDLTPVTTAVDIYFQFYDNTGALVTAAQYVFTTTQAQHAMTLGQSPQAYGTNATGINTGIVLNTSAVGIRVGSSTGIAGTGTIPNIRAAGRPKSVLHMTNYFGETSVYLVSTTGSGWRSVNGAITGFRLAFSTGNIASGAFSAWGSP